MNRLAEIAARQEEIRALLSDEEQRDLDLDALEKELRDLAEEKKQIEKRAALKRQAEEIAGKTAAPKKKESRSIETFTTGADDTDEEQRELEERGQALLEKRAVTVASGDLVLPKHTSSTIAGTFNQISSLIDRVKHTPLDGGESYESPYEVNPHGEGEYTGEGEDYHDVEPTFDYATISKTKITAYSEETEETQKLPKANYSSIIQRGIGQALRKKLTRDILIGTGETGRLVGIFTDKATAIDPATDLEISGIDETTLDNIIFSYGGEENVEDVAVLILSKRDLKAFAMLRDNQDRKVYDVKSQGNTGTIDGVPYIINSACAAISNPATVAGGYVMAYGPLSNYELATFSPTDIQHSTDYKFKQGMIAHRGSVFAGGNVTVHNGFLRVKKAPTA
jgi:HK97 family phage major capsid protein